MPSSCSLTKALKLGAVGTPRSLRLHLHLPQRSSHRQIQMESGSYDRPRGALIVLEGLDRCGKTSQSSRLVSHLEKKGFSVESWRFPDRTTSVGEMISAYLSNKSQLEDRTIHLLFSANRWEKRLLMESKLKSGTTLVVDRYSYSGVAFSAAKGLDIEWCKAPEIGLVAPDLVVYLDIPPEKAAERGDYGHERYEKLEFQLKVAQYYQVLRDETWKNVDACLPMEEVEKQLRELALESVTACQRGNPCPYFGQGSSSPVKEASVKDGLLSCIFGGHSKKWIWEIAKKQLHDIPRFFNISYGIFCGIMKRMQGLKA